jgi:hypothetical protein
MAFNSALRFITTIARSVTVRCRLRSHAGALRWRKYPNKRPYLPRSGLFSYGPLPDITPLAAAHYFSFTNGLVTLRARSMKSSATGLSVRFFKVMIPTGHG